MEQNNRTTEQQNNRTTELPEFALIGSTEEKKASENHMRYTIQQFSFVHEYWYTIEDNIRLDDAITCLFALAYKFKQRIEKNNIKIESPRITTMSRLDMMKLTAAELVELINSTGVYKVRLAQIIY